MKAKGDNCYSVTKEEFRAALDAGGVLRLGKFGPWLWAESRELHPRRDTVRRMIASGELVESEDANAVQRKCGMSTFRLGVGTK